MTKNSSSLILTPEVHIHLLESEEHHRIKTDPLRWHDLFPLQQRFHEDKTKDRILFGGNRSGKTEAVADYINTKCLEKPKQRWWCVSETYQDSIAIQQRKIWELLPKNKIRYGHYDEINGFTNRKILFNNGTLIQFKCLPRGSNVLMSDNSLKDIFNVDIGKKIKDVFGNKRKVINKFIYKRQLIVSIKTKGHDIRCTKEHKFFIIDKGWVEAKNIKKGDVIETKSFFGEEDVATWKPRVLALLIAEGCLVSKSPDFTTTSDKVIEAVKEVLPCDIFVKKVSGKYQPWGYRLSSNTQHSNRIKQYLVKVGLWGKKADHKFIPEEVFRWDKESQRDFLKMLFSCDGSVERLFARYTTSSEKLALDVQALLWNFDIHADFRKVNNRHYYLGIYGEQRRRFDEIGSFNKDIRYETRYIRKRIREGTVLDIRADDQRLDVCCLEIEGSHEFIANGLRTHNSYDQERESFQGDDIDGVWLDEEPPYDIYKECRMRLIDRNGELLISMTSLKGITDLIADIFEGHDVIESQYAPLIGQELPRIAERGKFRFYFLWTTENEKISQERVLEEAKLLTRDEITCRIYGMPINLTGKIYMSFNKAIHVTSIEAMPEGKYSLYHVLDPHDRKPWAMIWLAVHKTGSIYCVDEYPNTNFNDISYDDKTYEDYKNIIKSKEDNLYELFRTRVRRRIIDPNFGNKTVQLARRQGGQSTTTPKKELMQLGFNFRDGIDALEAGHLEVRKYLHYQRNNDNGEITAQPILKICDNCINTITHLSRYSRKDILAADGDVKDKVQVNQKYKDFNDCLRYGIMSKLVYEEPQIKEIEEFRKKY